MSAHRHASPDRRRGRRHHRIAFPLKGLLAASVAMGVLVGNAALAHQAVDPAILSLIQPGEPERDDVLLEGATMAPRDAARMSPQAKAAFNSLIQQSQSGTAGATTRTAPEAATEAVTLTPELRAAILRANRIERGRRLFLFETFGGNGRTCGTCHPPSNNFTIDPAFIATLPATDPLFVAETNPELAGLEDSALLRSRGLILENLDGFDRPGVLRSVQHTLGMRPTIGPDVGALDGSRPPFPLVNMTGWSGDGSPGDGSLRNFVVGAILQHMPKRLARVPDVDFVLPTHRDLDALLDFQLSLGRQADIITDTDDPAALVFKDPSVEDGKFLFKTAPARDGSTRSCNGCHENSGANDADGNGRNFPTGAAFAPNAPVCSQPTIPIDGDGGFGPAPETIRNGSTFCADGSAVDVVFRGDLAINSQSVIEAADTPPFFHNNIAETIEDTVVFYTSDTFNNSGSGGGRGFVLSPEEINKIAAFMRTLNVLDNIRGSNVLDSQAKWQFGSRRRETIGLGVKETSDAIAVLTGGPLPIYTDGAALRLLEQARALQQRAQGRLFPQSLLNQAISLKNQARAAMVN